MKKIIYALLTVVVMVPCFMFTAGAKDYNNSSHAAFKGGACFQEYLVSEILDFNKNIDVSAYVNHYGWNDTDVLSQVDSLIYNYPEVFALDVDFYEYFWDDYTGARWLKFNYIFSKGQYDNAKAKIDAEADKILAMLDDSMTDAQKALVVHDYIVANTVYDMENDDKYTLYGCLGEGKAVCQGYSISFKYIMNLLGIDCYIVKSDEMWHTWNYIKLDGEYYHIDLVFDDPTVSENEKYYERTGQVNHNYFLISDQKISSSHKNWHFYNDVKKATSTKYENYFWKNVNSQVIPQGNYLYYMDYEKKADNITAKLIRRNIKTNKIKTLCRVNSKWYKWEEDDYYFKSFACLSYYGERFYFNTSKRVYSVDINGKDLKSVCKPKITNGYLFGCYAGNNGKLLMCFMKDLDSVPVYKKKYLDK